MAYEDAAEGLFLERPETCWQVQLLPPRARDDGHEEEEDDDDEVADEEAVRAQRSAKLRRIAVALPLFALVGAIVFMVCQTNVVAAHWKAFRSWIVKAGWPYTTGFLVVKGGTARNGVPMKNIFIFGPESTGTRFMSRSISRLIEPQTTWGGEWPPCKTHIDPLDQGFVNIQHLSLPWGDLCSGPINVVPYVDMCDSLEKLQFTRFLVDIEEALQRTPNSKAIVMTRDKDYALRSVLKKHCHNKEFALKERDTALRLIDKAIDSDSVGDRVLHITYETLGSSPELSWGQIYRFLGMDPAVTNFETPLFVSGNHVRRLAASAADEDHPRLR